MCIITTPVWQARGRAGDYVQKPLRCRAECLSRSGSSPSLSPSCCILLATALPSTQVEQKGVAGRKPAWEHSSVTHPILVGRSRCRRREEAKWWCKQVLGVLLLALRPPHSVRARHWTSVWQGCKTLLCRASCRQGLVQRKPVSESVLDTHTPTHTSRESSAAALMI